MSGEDSSNAVFRDWNIPASEQKRIRYDEKLGKVNLTNQKSSVLNVASTMTRLLALSG